MERLTKRERIKLSNGEQAIICKYDDSNCNDSCMKIQQCNWLLRVKEKLWNYENAEDSGLMKILPVAVGSDVFFIPSKVNYDLNVLNKHEENNRVYHQKVTVVTFTEHGWHLECDKDMEYGADRILEDRFYKETWFISNEEAEQALAKLNISR